MPTIAYSYTDPQGIVQSVDVTVDISNPTRVTGTGNPYTSGIRQKYNQTIDIELSQAATVPLQIYFSKTVTYTVQGQVTDTKTLTFVITLPEGYAAHKSILEQRQVLTGGATITTTYTFIEQPDAPIPEEDLEQVGIGEYGRVPVFFYQFNKVQHGLPKTVCRVEIYLEDFEGTTKELSHMQSSPISIRREGNVRDKYRPVWGSHAVVRLLAFEENEFKAIFTGQDATAQLRYYENNVLRFEGYNIAEFYRTNTSLPIQGVEVIFSDGIALLKKKDFSWATDQYRRKTIEIIWHILGGLKSTLPLYEKIYVYPTTIDYDISKGSVEYTEKDIRTYTDDQNQPYSCYQVLEAIFKPYGARIYAGWDENGAACWFIEEINAKKDALLRYRKYENLALTASGNMGDTPTYVDYRARTQLAQQLTQNRRFGRSINRSRNQVIRKPVHTAIIKKNLEFIPDLVPNFNGAANFGRGNAENELLEWTSVGGIQVSPDHVASLDTTGARIKAHGHPFQANAFQYESIYIESESQEIIGGTDNRLSLQFTFASVVGSFLNANGSPTNRIPAIYDHLNGVHTIGIPPKIAVQLIVTAEDDTSFYLTNTSGLPDWVTAPAVLELEPDSFTHEREDRTYTKLISELTIPATGQFKVRIYAPAIGTYSIPGASSDTQLEHDLIVIDIKTDYRTVDGFAKESETLTATAAIKKTEESYETEIIHADVDTLQNYSAITVDGELTTLWEKYRTYDKTAQSLPLADLLGQSIIENQYDGEAWVIENLEILENGADLRGQGFSPFRSVLFQDLPGRIFIPYAYDYSASPAGESGYGAKITATYVEVQDAQPLIDYTTDTIRANSGRSSSGSSSGSRLPNTLINENPFNPRSIAIAQEVVNPIRVYFDETTGSLVVRTEDFPGLGQSAEDNDTYPVALEFDPNSERFIMTLNNNNEIEVSDFAGRYAQLTGADFTGDVDFRERVNFRGDVYFPSFGPNQTFFLGVNAQKRLVALDNPGDGIENNYLEDVFFVGREMYFDVLGKPLFGTLVPYATNSSVGFVRPGYGLEDGGNGYLDVDSSIIASRFWVNSQDFASEQFVNDAVEDKVETLAVAVGGSETITTSGTFRSLSTNTSYKLVSFHASGINNADNEIVLTLNAGVILARQVCDPNEIFTFSGEVVYPNNVSLNMQMVPQGVNPLEVDTIMYRSSIAIKDY